jgi:hypothetical protein
MSRYRKKPNFMNIFGKAEDDRSLLHSSSKLDGSIDGILYDKDPEEEQPASDSAEECSGNSLDAAAVSTQITSKNATTQIEDTHEIHVDGSDNQDHPESPKATERDRVSHVERDKNGSPRRTIREKLRGGTPIAGGEKHNSPRKSFMKRSISERFMGAVKPVERSPKGGSKVKHIGEIKVNFAAVAEPHQSQNSATIVKPETDSPPKTKTLLKSFVKKNRKAKENSRVDTAAHDSLKTKVTATIQIVHSSDLQDSFNQLNLGEFVPEVICQAVQSKDLAHDFKRRNNDHYRMSDSSSDDESTDVSDSTDMPSTQAETEQVHDHDPIRNAMSHPSERSNEDLNAYSARTDEEEETRFSTGAGFPCAFDSLEDKAHEHSGKTKEAVHSLGTLPESEETNSSRTPNEKKYMQTEKEPRPCTYLSSHEKPRRRSLKETLATQMVEVAFSPPSSPKEERQVRRSVAELLVAESNDKGTSCRSPPSKRTSPRQRKNEVAPKCRQFDEKLGTLPMSEQLNGSSSDVQFAEMKSVLDDFERMDIADFLKNPNEHLKDVDFNMSTIPLASCYIDVKDLDFSENMTKSEKYQYEENELQFHSSREVTDVSFRYWRLHEELEQSRVRFMMISQEVAQSEREVEQLRQRLDELERVK